MALVPAICTRCGAQIEVDNTHEAGICKHCGTAFITERAITNYNYYITNNNVFDGATIIQEVGFQKLLNVAEGYLKLDDLINATKTFEKMTKEYPQKFESWYGLWSVKVKEEKKRKRQTNSPLKSQALENAKKLASEQQSSILNKAIGDYTNLYRASVTRARQEYNSRFGMFENFVSYVNSHSALKSSYQGPSIFYKKGKVIYEIIKIDIDGAPVESYEYTIVGYNSNNNTFELSNNVEVYDYYPEKHFKCKNRHCNLQLIAEDYSDDNLFTYYYSGSTTHVFNFCFKEIVDGRECYRLFSEDFKLGFAGKPTSSSLGCYIATCIYGSYDCPQVWTLRRFRDNTLDATWYGRLFIKCYYAISPTLVKWFGEQKWFRTFWKNRLDKMVSKLNKQGVEDTEYSDKF